jgi:hypothetical protein
MIFFSLPKSTRPILEVFVTLGFSIGTLTFLDPFAGKKRNCYSFFILLIWPK